MTETGDILQTFIGEEFVYVSVQETFTLIGESQHGGLLIEWSSGELESMSPEEWNDKLGLEIRHIPNVTEENLP